ncbi:UDP-N-acetylmuramate dehydrogenase [Candidatus Sumerlaeota bacterium]|nr:UDP-N-acetylmuramate dehydrogenase [Candidatus Sumerlaeota bacterium]
MIRRTSKSSLFDLHDPALKISSNHDLSNKTSMKMSAVAAIHAEVDSPFALKKVLRAVKQEEVPTFILGGGKNTLFATSYFDGVVITMGRNFAARELHSENTIRVGAALQLPTLIKFAHECGLMGLEFLTMVPGTVGGALACNAGAGGEGLCDFVERVWVMARDGMIYSCGKDDFTYEYRHSSLRDFVIMEVELKLRPLNVQEAERKADEFRAKKTNQPYHIPSSGCIFKNPTDPKTGLSVSAGKLIDDCDLKNYSIRSAQVSQGHANFIVNNGNSSGEDFLALISLVRDIVQHRTGIEMELEVQIVGGPLNGVVLA